MTEYCLFTVTHPNARRVYIRGVADISEPIDEYDRIIEFYHGHELKSGFPPNPYEKENEEYKLFNELLSAIKMNWEDFGDDLIFVNDEEEFLYLNHRKYEYYTLDMEKVIIP